MKKDDIINNTFGVLDHVPIGVFVLCSDFVVRFWNSCLEDWTGIERAKIVGTKIDTRFSHLTSPRYASRLESIFEGGPPTIFSSQLHKSIIPSPLPGGELRVQHTTVTAIEAPDENAYYALFAVQDVTNLTQRIQGYRQVRNQALAEVQERKRAEERQAQLLLELESANQELNDFAYIVSHDLKAPLRGINSIVDWLSVDYAERLDEEGHELLELLSSRARRMHELIDGILEYSRVGRVQENRIEVNLNQIVAEVVQGIAFPEHIELKLERELPSILCEKVRIEQVFQNLISNAVKYMDKPKGEVRIGCAETETHWTFHVVDNGPGIADHHFKKIFQIFQTLVASEDSESTGVGLAVAKKIVETSGGRIWVESKVGEGSTFFFTWAKSGVPGRVSDKL